METFLVMYCTFKHFFLFFKICSLIIIDDSESGSIRIRIMGSGFLFIYFTLNPDAAKLYGSFRPESYCIVVGWL